MALNIKNAEVERLAAEAARLGRASKTQAIRRALEEHVAQAKRRGGARAQADRVQAMLLRFRKKFPKGDFGRAMPKEERESVLGYGPEGF
ncbi:MAG: type II toxin-antitoxin system VapB family antitoxin [Acidobacteria bacterium]|nr:type II toxin-antitoxin system VapB family antitoxin [Acidobacteriota bacterium]